MTDSLLISVVLNNLDRIESNKSLLIDSCEFVDVNKLTIVTIALTPIKSKNADLVVANDVTKEGAGFDVDTNIVTICTKDGQVHPYDKMLKSEVANVILDEISRL